MSATEVGSEVMSPEPQLAGQTLLVIGGSSGIGRETAERARAEGADVIITARNADRLQRVGLELGASIAAFDATDFGRLERFFGELPAPIDHVLVTGPGPYYVPLADFDASRLCPMSVSMVALLRSFSSHFSRICSTDVRQLWLTPVHLSVAQFRRNHLPGSNCNSEW